MTTTVVRHVAGPFASGRQECARCGVPLVSTNPTEVGGITLWPPPFPEDEEIAVEWGSVPVSEDVAAYLESAGLTPQEDFLSWGCEAGGVPCFPVPEGLP